MGEKTYAVYLESDAVIRTASDFLKNKATSWPSPRGPFPSLITPTHRNPFPSHNQFPLSPHSTLIPRVPPHSTLIFWSPISFSNTTTHPPLSWQNPNHEGKRPCPRFLNPWIRLQQRQDLVAITSSKRRPPPTSPSHGMLLSIFSPCSKFGFRSRVSCNGFFSLFSWICQFVWWLVSCNFVLL